MEKSKMKYRVANCKNPKTGGAMLRPIITERPTMSLKSLVEYAKNASYVRGQTKDLEGLLGGFVQAMQDRAKAGYSININDWFIISGQLKGQVNATGQLTDANSYHVTITASKDLKVGIDNFSWENVDDDGENVRVTGLSYVGAPQDKQLKKNVAIWVSGRNLAYVAAAGDKVTISWTEESEGGATVDKTADIVPTESDFGHMKFDWPAALNDAAVGTEVAFSFRTHGGKSEGAVKPADRSAVVIG